MSTNNLATTLPYDGGLTAALEVADLHAAVAWYQRVLGMEVNYVMDEIAWAELKSPVPGVTVGLGQVEAPQARGGATLTWGTTDLPAFRATLEGMDVRFDGDTDEVPGMVRFATFFDPDGNRHMLYEDLSS